MLSLGRWHRPADGLAAISSLCLLLYVIILLSLPTPHHCATCSPPERDALLSFLSNLSSSSHPFLSGTWAPDKEPDCCRWEGVSCDSGGSVAHLWLPYKGLTGPISPSLADLSRLTQLNLSHNRLNGTLPQGLLWSDHLVILDVSFNRLSGELPQSPPPPPASDNNSRQPLQTLNLSSNLFTGEFSPFSKLTQDLREVDASNNSFSGPIPSTICGASRHLHLLNLDRNQFSGDIPKGLGRCQELSVFRAGFNNISGRLPDDLYDIVSLRQLSLPFNQLSGVIDGVHIVGLSRLAVFDLSGNILMGELPAGIGKLWNLEQLLIHDNRLNGTLPSTLGNCTKLSVLNLRGNSLTGNISAVDFSALSHLTTLDLGENRLTGDLPASIHSCRSLTALRLSENLLSGDIRPKMQNLRSLSYLSLSDSRLTNISRSLQILKGCRNLTVLILSNNFQGEAIPSGADFNWTEAFPNLQVLSLAQCGLTGQIPSWLAGLKKLEALDLPRNQLTGSVPSWLGTLSQLFYVDLSHNLLTGGLPLGITGLQMLSSEQAYSQIDQSYLELPVFVVNMSGLLPKLLYNQVSHLPPAIYLRNNSLDGVIPPEIGLLRVLHTLDLSHNNFSGEIPVQICNLTNLEMLNLSENHLSGTIPPMLGSLHFLSSFSVAFNDLSGPIPTGGQFNTFPNSSFEGNEGLCGPVLLQHPCTTNGSKESSFAAHRNPNKRLLIGLILIICFGGAFVVATLLIIRILWSRRRSQGGDKMHSDTISSNNWISGLSHVVVSDPSKPVMIFPGNLDIENLTISDIMRATDNFSQEHIIGCGGFGVVYKATLPDGTNLAVKRLSGDIGLMEREFRAEVEALSVAQHKNLVSLWGYCVHDGFWLLIYSYMENGSLDYWLHERVNEEPVLDWPTRLRIAQGASRGLSYIHQICEPHIVHRDIKSSNILLDEEFEAHVADFGLSRLILPCNTHVTTELVGTLGYIPPEYGQAWMATMRGDIYSFGVVLLELLTGRRPVDFFQPKLSGELVAWVQQMRCQGNQDEVLDPLLRNKGFEEQMLQVLDVACLCINHNPFKRPTIKEVVTQLENAGTDARHLVRFQPRTCPCSQVKRA